MVFSPSLAPLNANQRRRLKIPCKAGVRTAEGEKGGSGRLQLPGRSRRDRRGRAPPSPLPSRRSSVPAPGPPAALQRPPRPLRGAMPGAPGGLLALSVPGWELGPPAHTHTHTPHTPHTPSPPPPPGAFPRRGAPGVPCRAASPPPGLAEHKEKGAMEGTGGARELSPGSAAPEPPPRCSAVTRRHRGSPAGASDRNK